MNVAHSKLTNFLVLFLRRSKASNVANPDAVGLSRRKALEVDGMISIIYSIAQCLYTLFRLPISY